MRSLSATLLIIFLSACNIRSLEINQKYVDTYYKKCYERKYKFSKDYIGPIGDLVEKPFQDCDNVYGYSYSDYINLGVWLEDSRKACTNQSSK